MNLLFRYLCCCLYLHITFTYSLQAQNLVSNPSFEEHKRVPCQWITDKAELADIVQSWTAPTLNMPHLFSTTANTECWTNQPNSSFSGNIECIFGNETPQEGEFMVGLFTYGQNRRSYLQIKLNTPLVVGELYELSMWVSLAEHLGFASNGLGMAFHDEEIELGTYGSFDIAEEVILFEEPVTTQDGWEQLTGRYEATDEYTHLLIGNFKNDGATKNSPLENPQCRSAQAFYFVDNVVVKPISLELQVDGPSDVLCAGEQVILSVSGASNYQWYAASDTNQVIGTSAQLNTFIDATETFIVKGEINEKEARGTFTVQINPNEPIETDNIHLCGTGAITLAPGDYETYTWKDGSTAASLRVDQPGSYAVTVTDIYGCEFTASYRVREKTVPSIQFENIPSLCYSESVELKVAETGYDFLWDNGSTSDTRTINEVGTYKVTITNEFNCSTVLEAEINDKNCVCNPLIPNAFSPNGDGINDEFGAIIPCPINAYTLSIFDRWGKPVFESTEQIQTWNGYHDETYLRMGVYAWILVYEDENGKVFSKRGNVTLIR